MIRSRRHNKKYNTMSIIQEKVQRGEIRDFVFDGDVLKSENRLCVPQMTKLKEKILKETQNTPYTVHLGSTKMFQDIRSNF